MDLDEAMKKAVQKFYDGHGYTEYEAKTGRKLKYNKKTFDELEADIRKKIKPMEVEQEVEDDV